MALDKFRFDQMSVEELLEEYNELERKLYSMGKGYRDIPQGAFGNLESWIDRKGYKLVKPKQGLSTLLKR